MNKHNFNDKKAKRLYLLFAATAMMITVFCTSVFAETDPLAVVNNLSDFIFSLIRAIGLILLGFGILQIGLALKSHDASQRANGINHAQQEHHNVPLWVVANALTFGNISKMYLVLPCDLQTRVSKNYPQLNEVQLGNMLAIAAQYRNVCAHGERLFSYKTKSAIPDMPLHKKLGIPKCNQQYSSGKQDLFSVVIALRYLLPSDLFLSFKRELVRLIKKHLMKTGCYTESEFLAYMGFPENWASITKYKKI